MSDLYVLDGKTPVHTDDVIEWGRWRETHSVHVALTKISDTVEVSTVFLGLDHGYGGLPILFETMVFGGPLDQEQVRYSTWEEAEKGHEEMVSAVRAAEAKEEGAK